MKNKQKNIWTIFIALVHIFDKAQKKVNNTLLSCLVKYV